MYYNLGEWNYSVVGNMEDQQQQASEWLNQAIEAFDKGLFSGASSLCKQMLKLSELTTYQKAKAYFILGVIAYRYGQYQQSFELAQKAYLINSQDHEIENFLAVCFYNLGQNDLALKHFRNVAQTNPTEMWTHRNQNPPKQHANKTLTGPV